MLSCLLSLTSPFLQEVPDRALDIGCAVGRASFELASHFGEVIGIDYSQQFVNTCNKLKELGRLDYEMLVEGKLTSKHVAVVPEGLVSLNDTFHILLTGFRLLNQGSLLSGAQEPFFDY